MNRALTLAVAVSLGLTGCYLGSQDSLQPGGSSGPSGAGGGGGAAAAGTSDGHIDGTTSGLPCDVAALLGHYCTGCHGTPPSGGAPQSMLSAADLTATARSVPAESVGALSVQRMQDGSMPPKPAGSVPASDIATFAAWVNAGMPAGACAGFDAGTPVKSPYDTPVQCSSGTTWTQGNEGSSRMRPGEPCIACHDRSGGEAPSFSIAGTVYPTAHEPDGCNGAGSADAITVVVTGADGTVLSLRANTAGNFSSRTRVATPYNAKVVVGGRERAMSAAQTSGDCNSCHTVSGAENAPGRIMAP